MRKVSLLLVLAGLLTKGNLRGQPASPLVTLEPGKPIERELKGGEAHTYEVQLADGQYARVTVEQRGIDVIVSVEEPGEKGSLEFDSELRLEGEETAEIAADTAGVCRIHVAAKYKRLAEGRYSITLAEVRSAGAKDRSLHTARRLAAESLRVLRSGKYPEARRLAEQALQIREKELGEQHRDTASAAWNLALVCMEQEDYDCSQQFSQRALRIRESLLRPEHPDVAAALMLLGRTFSRREDYSRAIPLLQRALTIQEKALPANHPEIARLINLLASVYTNRGDLARAEEAFRRALAIQEQVVDPEDRSIEALVNNLGVLYDERGDFAQAAMMYRRAIATREKKFGPNHPDLRHALGNLAAVYSNMGQYAEAEATFERLLKLLESTLGPSQRSTGFVSLNFATHLRRRGDHARAAQLYQRALRIFEAALGPESTKVAETLTRMAMNYESSGQLVEAITALQRAARITDRELALNLSVGSDRQKLAYLSVLPERTYESISLSVGAAAHLPEAHELGAGVVLRTKGRVQDAIAGNLTALRQRMDAESQRLLDEWKKTTEQLAALVLEGPGAAGSAAEHQGRIKGLEERREQIEERLSRHNVLFFEQWRPVNVASIQRVLPSDSALIEFAVYRRMNPAVRIPSEDFGAPRYAAFVIRRSRPVAAYDLGDAAEVEIQVTRLREAMRDPKRYNAYEIARALDERVIEPFRGALDGVSQLLISPDGALNLIPFAALRDRKGRYLVESHRLSYLTSGRDLLRLRSSGEGAAGRPLIVADPSFGLPVLSSRSPAAAQAAVPRRSVTTGADLSSLYFAPLAGASREARSIAGLFPDSLVLTGTQATKSSLSVRAAPLLLHIATHGFFLDDRDAKDSSSPAAGQRFETGSGIRNPLLRSGLALAGANASSRDGIFTALEASALNLQGTRLVTLSACDTGLGEVKNGEGVYGLRRAFLLAGAESIVMSLWPVSDQVTRELMTAYYGRLSKGEGRGEALRQVQLSMMKRQERQHPFYWASFIQSGEWASLDGKR